MLAVIEEAHSWVFRGGSKVDPATGGALTPLPEQFGGIEIGVLTRLLDLGRPEADAHDRVDPGLLLTLQMLQGVLWVSRAGVGATRFRLALKDFLPAATDDNAVGPLLRLMQARVATRALDAADQIIAGNDDGGEAWELLEPLAPLLDALVSVDVRSDRAAVEASWSRIMVYATRRRLAKSGPCATPSRWADPNCGVVLPPSRHAPEAISIDLRNDLAGFLMNRGAAKADGGDLAGAIADYSAAIALKQAIRTALGDAWPVPMQNDLATSLQNRGKAEALGGAFAGAIAEPSRAPTASAPTRSALNSNDRRFPIGIAFGSRVSVCDNLAFSGEQSSAASTRSRPKRSRQDWSRKSWNHSGRNAWHRTRSSSHTSKRR